MKNAASVLLQPGALTVIPTDTVYGLAARAADKAAVQRLYEAKPRDRKPGTVIAANIDQLVELGMSRRYLKAVEQYWPAALSVVIPCGEELAYMMFDKRSLAVRIPDDEPLRAMLEQTGPLLTTSANAPGEPTATNVAEARQFFADAVDYYQDGGDLSGRPPSTVIRVVDDAIEILRRGAVDIDETGRITQPK